MNRCTVALWSYTTLLLSDSWDNPALLLNPVNLASFLPEIDAKTKQGDMSKTADASVSQPGQFSATDSFLLNPKVQ